MVNQRLGIKLPDSNLCFPQIQIEGSTFAANFQFRTLGGNWVTFKASVLSEPIRLAEFKQHILEISQAAANGF